MSELDGNILAAQFRELQQGIVKLRFFKKFNIFKLLFYTDEVVENKTSFDTLTSSPKTFSNCYAIILAYITQ